MKYYIGVVANWKRVFTQCATIIYYCYENGWSVKLCDFCSIFVKVRPWTFSHVNLNKIDLLDSSYLFFPCFWIFQCDLFAIHTKIQKKQPAVDVWRVFDSQIANESKEKHHPFIASESSVSHIGFPKLEEFFSLAVILRLAETIELNYLIGWNLEILGNDAQKGL